MDRRKLICETLKFIDENFGNKMVLDELAEISGYSVPQFSRLFTEFTGITPMRYVNVVRIQNSTVMLSKTDRSITEIDFVYGSPDLKVFETSGLYFYYTDRKWNNSDGTDNSVYGTAPDIYVPFDEESMKARDKLMVNNEVIYTYENRLKWDNVLIETLKLIKEDENGTGNNTADE